MIKGSILKEDIKSLMCMHLAAGYQNMQGKNRTARRKQMNQLL